MNTYTRNTILYSLLTVSLVGAYWLVRQQPAESPQGLHLNSAYPMIEINEPASEGYAEAQLKTVPEQYRKGQRMYASSYSQ